MLDLDWERYVPLMDIHIGDIQKIFAQYDKTLTVSGFEAIRLGCRNSNYAVGTNRGKFLLRVTNSADFNNEPVAYRLVKDRVTIPALLFHTTAPYGRIFIYQYIEGVSLQKVMAQSRRCEMIFVKQAAEAAAVIHNTPPEKLSGLKELDVPPFALWYQSFLDTPAVAANLGGPLRDRVLRLVQDKQAYLPEIDAYQSFIHCDFRPANMLVDNNQRVFFVDWESACTGHSLADIGQFFRYRTFFTQDHFALFEQVYHSVAHRKLPPHWFELALFRDLVNPLQLLSSVQNAPRRRADFIKIIEETLAYWGY